MSAQQTSTGLRLVALSAQQTSTGLRSVARTSTGLRSVARTSTGLRLVALFREETFFFFEFLLPFIINHNVTNNDNLS
jgi:hypothetical protein